MEFILGLALVSIYILGVRWNIQESEWHIWCVSYLWRKI